MIYNILFVLLNFVISVIISSLVCALLFPPESGAMVGLTFIVLTIVLFILFWKRFKRPSSNLKQTEQTVQTSGNTNPKKSLKENISNLIKFLQEHYKKANSLEWNEQGFAPVLKIGFGYSPLRFQCRVKGRSRIEEFTLNSIMIDKEGSPYFDVQDEFDNRVAFAYEHITSQIHFKKKSFTTLEQFIKSSTNYEYWSQFQKKRNKYLQQLQKDIL